MKNYIAIIASLLIYPHALFTTSTSTPSLKKIAAQSFLAQAPKINKPRAIRHFYAPPHDTDYDNYFSCVTRSAKQHIEAANIPEDLKRYLYTKAKQNITNKKKMYEKQRVAKRYPRDPLNNPLEYIALQSFAWTIGTILTLCGVQLKV